MANFKIAENGLDIGSFDLPLGRAIKLLQWGGDGSRKRLDLALDRSAPGVSLTVLPDSAPAASTYFTVQGTTPNVDFRVGAFVSGSGQTARYSEDLKVRVRARPTKQPGYKVDLISELALSGNAKQVHAYSRIINDPSDSTHILSQNTQPGHFNCGDTAADYGPKIFGKAVSVVAYTYYQPPRSNLMADLRFDAARVKLGIDKIFASLDRGIPVRVWLIHHDGFATPVIRPDTRTHYLTIVGYSTSGTKFLYLDPWPHGSRLNYDGGMYAKKQIAFIGELEFDRRHLEFGIVSPFGSAGLHAYKVIAGP